MKYNKSKPTSTERSVVHILCMMLMIISTLITPVIATGSFSNSLTASPESLPFQGLVEEGWKQGGREFYQVQNAVEEDYGVWNPAPRYGGGNAAPVPHADVSFSRTTPFP
ncbi:hypothetical protein ACOSQ3_011284 [Xanthoceras sorbifolium]